MILLAGSWPGHDPGSNMPEQQTPFALPAKGVSLGFGASSSSSTVEGGGGDLEVQLVDWAVFLLDMDGVACRDHQLGITGSVLVRLKWVPPRHVA